MLFLISLDMNLIGKKNVYLSLIIQARCIYVYVCIYNVARISISNSFICLTLCCNLVKSKLLILPILYCEYCIVLYSFCSFMKMGLHDLWCKLNPKMNDKLGNNMPFIIIKICISLYLTVIMNSYDCLNLHTAQNDRFLFLSESYLFIYWWVFLSSPCNACE